MKERRSRLFVEVVLQESWSLRRIESSDLSYANLLVMSRIAIAFTDTPRCRTLSFGRLSAFFSCALTIWRPSRRFSSEKALPLSVKAAIRVHLCNIAKPLSASRSQGQQGNYCSVARSIHILIIQQKWPFKRDQETKAHQTMPPKSKRLVSESVQQICPMAPTSAKVRHEKKKREIIKTNTR